MIEYRVKPIERYEVTRFSDQNDHVGVTTVASDLTAEQANNIAGAMYERANGMGMVAKATYSGGESISNE